MNSKKLILGIYALMLSLFIISCSTTDHLDSEAQVLKSTQVNTVPTIAIGINGGNIVPNLTKSILSKYKEGITLRQLLEGSGVIKLTADGKDIVSVNEVALDSRLHWGILLNGNPLTSGKRMDMVIKEDDILEIVVKETKTK
ncbi:hypothetical protein [Paenibacillus terrigena]|uniref:hypothetical protein n=1 Tax=Paenibacillus terrigena TaxID=369333 RepID=UPI0003673117|nr:hypothetical protein [Paenibacillus terrigena]